MKGLLGCAASCSGATSAGLRGPPAAAEVLACFEEDLRFTASVELHPALRAAQEGGAAGGLQRLSDLLDVPRLWELQAACSRSHRHFAAKVGACPASIASVTL